MSTKTLIKYTVVQTIKAKLKPTLVKVTQICSHVTVWVSFFCLLLNTSMYLLPGESFLEINYVPHVSKIEGVYNCSLTVYAKLTKI